MRLNSKIILLISIVTAFLGFSLTLNTLNTVKKSPAEVLVATAMRDLDFGDTLVADDVSLVAPPKGTDLNISFQKLDKVIGKVVRNPLRRGQPISNFDLINDKDNINGLIPEGYRAATVPISMPKENLETLKFGSRVDILFADSSDKNVRTKTIMKNILIMRVNSGSQQGGGIGGGGQDKTAFVTLAVKPEAAETLTYATQKGSISLSVRPILDRNMKEEYVSLDELLGINHSLTSPVFNSEVEIIRGTTKETVKL